jgi:hypothetical protein
MKVQSVAFTLGFNAGVNAGNWIAESVLAVGEHLQADKALTVAAYKALRADWVKGYATGYGSSEKRAENAWATVWKGVELAYGFKKPQSAVAAAKQASRAKVTKADKPQTAGNVKAPTTGSDKADALKLELSSMEAHIISLWRAGKFGVLVDIARKEAEKTDAA